MCPAEKGDHRGPQTHQSLKPERQGPGAAGQVPAPPWHFLPGEMEMKGGQVKGLLGGHIWDPSEWVAAWRWAPGVARIGASSQRFYYEICQVFPKLKECYSKRPGLLCSHLVLPFVTHRPQPLRHLLADVPLGASQTSVPVPRLAGCPAGGTPAHDLFGC